MGSSTCKGLLGTALVILSGAFWDQNHTGLAAALAICSVFWFIGAMYSWNIGD